MSYQWKAGEGVADGFRRIAVEELTEALDGLADPTVLGVEATVHGARKHCKKVRGLARLVRPGLAKADFRAVNQGTRDAAAELSSFRDAHALLATFDRLLVAPAGELERRDLEVVRAELARRADEASRAVADGGDKVEAARDGLEAVREIVVACDVEDDLDVVLAGARTTYERGRDAMTQAAKAEHDEDLHEWRKREKDLWYATRLVTSAAPAVLGPQAKLLHVLSEDLGDDHDLAVLADLIGVDPEAFGGEGAARPSLDRAALARADLQHHAFGLGGQVYAESPKAFTRRLKAYWRAWERGDPDLPAG